MLFPVQQTFLRTLQHIVIHIHQNLELTSGLLLGNIVNPQLIQ